MKSLLVISTAAAAIVLGAPLVGAQPERLGNPHPGISPTRPDDSATRRYVPNAGDERQPGEARGNPHETAPGRPAARDDEPGASEFRPQGAEQNLRPEPRHGAHDANRPAQGEPGLSGSSQPPQPQGPEPGAQQPSPPQGVQIPKARHNTQMRDQRFNETAQPREENERPNATIGEQRFNERARPEERNERRGAQVRERRRNETAQPKGAETLRGHESGAGQRTVEQQERSGNHTGAGGLHWTAHPGFSVSVGAVVPHTERLHALPSRLTGRFPEYRGDKYIAFRDRIAIVQPHTSRVIAVLPAASFGIGVGVGSSMPPRGAALVLSPQERERISARIRSVSLRPGFVFTVGAVVPRSVELLPVPPPILAVAPQLRGYRFVSTCGRFAIVDPATMRIVAVLPG